MRTREQVAQLGGLADQVNILREQVEQLRKEVDALKAGAGKPAKEAAPKTARKTTKQ